MRCIFCQLDSRDSRSVEHIIPESLGNVEYTLPPGVVCDTCNNYFARKLEQPLLQNPWIVQARSSFGIVNKRKRVPPIEGILLPGLVGASLLRDPSSGPMRIFPTKERDNEEFVRGLQQGSLITLVGEPPNDRLMARFVGKVGLEALARRFLDDAGRIARVPEIADHSGFDELRAFVRMGAQPATWPISVRSLYPPEYTFDDGASVIHEWTLLYTDDRELFIVLALFGAEYTMNLGGPELDGYSKWLAASDGASPLYPNGFPVGVGQ